jgi:uncharacterized protein YbaR (Trm112 family)
MPARSPFQTPPRPHAHYQFPQDPGVPLACPVCRAGLVREEQRFVCRGPECRRAYLIRDGIPLLLESESVMLTAEDWSKVSGV